MAVEELVARLRADISQFESQMRRVPAITNQTQGAVTQSAGRMGHAFQLVENQVNSLTSRLGGLGTFLRTLGPIGIAAGAGIGAIAAGMTAVVTRGQSAEVSLAKINALLKTTQGVSGQTAESIEKLAQAIGIETLASVEGVRDAAAQLLTFRNVSGEAFGRTLRAAQDLASLGFGTLSSATVQLAKALEEPEIGLAALRRVGVSFSQSQINVIKSLAETGDQARAMSLILDTVEKQVGGAGKAAAEGLAGAFDTLGERIGNFFEAVNNNTGATGTLARGINAIADGVKAITDAINSGSAWKEFTDFFTKDINRAIELLDRLSQSNKAVEDLGTQIKDLFTKDITRAIELVGNLFDKINFSKQTEETKRFHEQLQFLSKELKAIGINNLEVVATLDEATQAELDQKHAIDAVTQARKEHGKEVLAFATEGERILAILQDQEEAIKKREAAEKKAFNTEKDHAEKTISLFRERLQLQETYNAEVERLEEQHARLSIQRLREGQRVHKDVLDQETADTFQAIKDREAGNVAANEQRLDDEKNMLRESQRQWERFGDRVQDIVADSITGRFDDILEGFKRLLIQMAAAAIAQQIVIPAIVQVVGAVGGQQAVAGAPGVSTGGVGGTANTASGLVRSGSTLLGGTSAGAGILGTTLFTVGGTAGTAGTAQSLGVAATTGGASAAGTAGTAGTAVTLGTVGTAGAAGVGVGLGLWELNNQLGITNATGRVGSGALAGAGGGAAAGTVILPGIGTAIGAIVGAAIGALTAWLTTPSKSRARITEFQAPQFDILAGERPLLGQTAAQFGEKGLNDLVTNKFQDLLENVSDALFRGLDRTLKPLPDTVESLFAEKINTLTAQFEEQIEGRKFQSKDPEKIIQKFQTFLEKELPETFDKIFGNTIERIQQIAPAAESFDTLLQAIETIQLPGDLNQNFKDRVGALRTTLNQQFEAFVNADFPDAIGDLINETLDTLQRNVQGGQALQALNASTQDLLSQARDVSLGANQAFFNENISIINDQLQSLFVRFIEEDYSEAISKLLDQTAANLQRQVAGAQISQGVFQAAQNLIDQANALTLGTQQQAFSGDVSIFNDQIKSLLTRFVIEGFPPAIEQLLNQSLTNLQATVTGGQQLQGFQQAFEALQQQAREVLLPSNLSGMFAGIAERTSSNLNTLFTQFVNQGFPSAVATLINKALADFQAEIGRAQQVQAIQQFTQSVRLQILSITNASQAAFAQIDQDRQQLLQEAARIGAGTADIEQLYRLRVQAERQRQDDQLRALEQQRIAERQRQEAERQRQAEQLKALQAQRAAEREQQRRAAEALNARVQQQHQQNREQLSQAQLLFLPENAPAGFLQGVQKLYNRLTKLTNQFLTAEFPDAIQRALDATNQQMQRLTSGAQFASRILQSVRQLQDSLINTFESARQNIEEGLLDAAAIVARRRGKLEDLFTQFQFGTPSQQLQLGPQIAQLAQEVFQLVRNPALTGESPGQLVGIQRELLTMLDEVQSTTLGVTGRASNTAEATLQQMIRTLDVNQQQLQALNRIEQLLSGNFVGSFQTMPGQSRRVPRTGFALVHQGETVSRGGGNGVYIGTVNVHTSGDPRQVSEALSRLSRYRQSALATR